MCGILGVFGGDAASTCIESGLETLLDRGPDSQKVVTPVENLVMGASRLAMTDPHERSNQPFTKNGNWIVFNGEIYNYKELRSKLIEEFALDFTTDSDTEVLIEILRIYGISGVELLRGMFSFVFFNHEGEYVLASRDRLGKKPLFFTLKNSNFFWASTIPALRKICKESKLSSDSILSYLSLGYTIDPNTIYSSIYALKPGFCYKVTKEGVIQEFVVKGLDFEPKPGYKANLDSSLRSAVADRIDGHNQIAISLSGGLDSTLIAKLSAESNKSVVAFSVLWSNADKERYNYDYNAAFTIAKNLGIEFIGVDFNSDRVTIEEQLQNFLIFMGEPNSNPTGVSLVPLYQKVAERGIRLVLTGDGADEIFGGYPRYESRLLGPNFRFLSDSRFLNLTSNLPSFVEKSFLRFSKPDYSGLWANFHWNFRPKELSGLVSKSFGKNCGELSRQIFKSIQNAESYNGTKDVNAIGRVMHRDSSIWLTNESNRKLDRISMAFSIEARSPFQDERVVSLAKQMMMSFGDRYLKKQILWDLYPELINIGVRKDKAGFISPVGHWLRSNPRLVDVAFEALADSGLFQNDKLSKRRKDQYLGQFDKLRQLWSLVVLGYWLRMQS